MKKSQPPKPCCSFCAKTSLNSLGATSDSSSIQGPTASHGVKRKAGTSLTPPVAKKRQFVPHPHERLKELSEEVTQGFSRLFQQLIRLTPKEVDEILQQHYKSEHAVLHTATFNKYKHLLPLSLIEHAQNKEKLLQVALILMQNLQKKMNASRDGTVDAD